MSNRDKQSLDRPMADFPDRDHESADDRLSPPGVDRVPVKLILEAIDDPVVVWDRSLKRMATNRAARKLFLGHSGTGNRGCSLCLTTDRGRKRICPVRQALRTGRIETGILPLNEETGTSCWLEVTGYPIIGPDGRVEMVLEIARDITSRLAAAETAGNDAEHGGSGLDSRNEVIWTLDSNFRFTYVSPSVEKLRGITPEQAMQETIEQTMTAESYLRVLEEVGRAAQAGKGDPNQVMTRVEVEQYRADGSTVWVEMLARTVVDGRNRIIGVQGVSRDISALKDVEDRLARSEAKYRALFQGGTDAVFLVGDTVIADCNDRVQEMFGFRREEMIGRSPVEFAPENQPDGRDSATAAHEWIQEAQAGQAQFFEWRQLRADGTEFDSEISLSPIDLPEGRHLMGVVRDISARKRAEAERERLQAQLLQSQKLEAVGTLAGGIAHDFNNILAAIIGYAELSQVDLPPGDAVADNQMMILKAAERARRLIGQIISFSRPGAMERRPVRLGAIVSEAVEMLRSSIPATVDMDIRLETGERDVTLADISQMHQLVMNLATNAAQAMEDGGGRLGLDLETAVIDRPMATNTGEVTPGEYLRLTVSDTGAGMDRETLDRIFEPFFTRRESGRGSGMGLAVVHGIVRSHGGAVSVDSAPDRGTVFTVLLPRTVRVTDELPRERATNARTGLERLMVVDDEEAIVDITARGLGRLGYLVSRFTSPLEAVEAFRETPESYDLVLTDLTMPGLTGLDLAREVAAVRPGLPVIIWSGHNQRLDPVRTRSAGVASVLTKPVPRDRLAAEIRRLLDSPGSGPVEVGQE